MQHMCDAQGGLEYLVQGVIKNVSQYISGEVTDFDEVGVKAVDDYTVEYTLEEPCSYFMTMLGYTIFMPMSRSYYQSQGGKFGAEYDSSAADYQYGKDSNSIAYCGPYLVTNATAKNTIVFKLSDSYWNKDNVNIKTLTWLFNDQSDVTKMYTDAKAGTVDYVNLNTSTMETAKSEGLYDQYAVVSDTDATSFMGFYNINRTATANANDGTTAKSTKSDEEIQRTNKALQNVHFRRAISFAADRGAYNAQQVGEDLKYTSLRNTFTPGYFVSLSKDTTIQINGTDTTFPAGTYYGEIVQKQIDADGVKIKVWDAENKTSDGFDGWYNPENAVVFTQKLSDVYRYILKSQEQGLVTLRNELEFLDSYIYLHQVRLGKCIQLENKIPPTLLNKKIPSLTLQLLIENVIKHNIINMENPMVIHLDYSDKDQTLSVRNKIKLKKNVAKSGMGLKNLSARYLLICNLHITIIDDSEYFTVKIPLLNE